MSIYDGLSAREIAELEAFKNASPLTSKPSSKATINKPFPSSSTSGEYLYLDDFGLPGGQTVSKRETAGESTLKKGSKGDESLFEHPVSRNTKSDSVSIVYPKLKEIGTIPGPIGENS